MMNRMSSIKNTDEIFTAVKKAYVAKNIPMPFPAANKQLQNRLDQFVSKGLMDNECVCYFDKVNSNRTYSIEKQNAMIQLMVQIKEKDQEPKKFIVLQVDDEINLIITSFLQIFEETGFLESTPKCHKRLRDTYAISDGRIRLVQRTLAHFIGSMGVDDGSIDKDGNINDGENASERENVGTDGNVGKGAIVCIDKNVDKDGNVGKDENVNNGENIKVKISRRMKKNNNKSNDENLPPISNESRVITRSNSSMNKKHKNISEHSDNTKHQMAKKRKNK